ncbi:hypothetical protein Gotri_014934 [Gossypium trilobum]|uniref:Uncharacterized protein n=1 Tax=Gossypium trilobum TaxID=34281 RepID=A0A7J9DZ58_9ROSI|nr:hypothetical protein [Gossypium trilobum]
MLSLRYELESELAWLFKKVKALITLETNKNLPTEYCYDTLGKTKAMDQRLERLEQIQKDMQDQLQA